MDLTGLCEVLPVRRVSAGRPIVVGVSGYGGSGKSTLTRRLVQAIPGAVRLRGDDFLDPRRSHTWSRDWCGLERDRLVAEVLRPFRDGEEVWFRRFDWDVGRLTEPQTLPPADYLVVDAVGLFHPITLPLLDVTIWCDVDLATATARGRERDRRAGHDHDRLWTEVWEPTERAFEEFFAPRGVAEVHYRPE